MARSPCKCEEPDRRLWRVVQFQSNRSAFSRGGYARSKYSEIRCLVCGWPWRTKAAYVSEIARAEGDEAYRLSEQDGGPKAEPRTRDEQFAQQQGKERWRI